jgi:hypothetical protein
MRQLAEKPANRSPARAAKPEAVPINETRQNLPMRLLKQVRASVFWHVTGSTPGHSPPSARTLDGKPHTEFGGRALSGLQSCAGTMQNFANAWPRYRTCGLHPISRPR